jgi:hypothetical protein
VSVLRESSENPNAGFHAPRQSLVREARRGGASPREAIRRPFPEIP